MFGSAVCVCVWTVKGKVHAQESLTEENNKKGKNKESNVFVCGPVGWSSSSVTCTVLGMNVLGPELNVQTDTEWASALKTLALFYLTAVQMWTDGIILATIWLWDWSPLLKHTGLSKENDEDCKAKRDSVHSLVKLGWNELRAAWQNAISTSTVVLIVRIKPPIIKEERYDRWVFFLSLQMDIAFQIVTPDW